jgi:hypothetical protein
VSGAEGEVICTVSCEVTDTVSPGSTEATTLLTASTRETRYDEEARSEIDSCRERGVELLTREFKPNLLRQIMPDPPLDLLHAITTIRALASQLTAARESGDEKLAETLTALAVDYLHIPERMLATDRDQARVTKADASR